MSTSYILTLKSMEGKTHCRVQWPEIPQKGDVIEAHNWSPTGTLKLSTDYYTVICTKGTDVTVHKGMRA